MEAAGQTLNGNCWEGPLGRYLPLVEAKMVNHFDHRFSTYEGATQAQLNVGALPRLDAAAHADPCRPAMPDYWVDAKAVMERVAGKTERRWLLGWRDICRNSDQRTVISAVAPVSAVGDKFLLAIPRLAPIVAATLQSILASFVLDYCARQKIGGTSLKYYLIRQLPLPDPCLLEQQADWRTEDCCGKWLAAYFVELTYTAWDLEAFGVDCGYAGPPFRWDEDRRFLLRAELDAAFFHLYLGTPNEWQRDASLALRAKLPTPRHAVDHIMETFPIVKKKDVEAHGTYRTKDTILLIYDEMAEAIRSGKPYQTRLDPPPAAQSCRHPESSRPSWAIPSEAR
jgi:hypothetical protein